MSASFEELDHRPTPMGALSLRRRREIALGIDVHEIKLDDEFLMSSLFTVAEIALARLGLAALSGADLDVVVGGLGLGYTAAAALDDSRLRSLVVVEALGEVIEWHRRGLIPLGTRLSTDARCRLVQGDFFKLAASPDAGFDLAAPGRRFDAVLLDVDHSPHRVLHPSHAAFYAPDGLRRLAAQLRRGGVFALWSDDPPDDAFRAALACVFESQNAHVVTFRHPVQDREATNTIYVARGARS